MGQHNFAGFRSAPLVSPWYLGAEVGPAGLTPGSAIGAGA